MYAVGVCWKRGKWIFSLYKRLGDAYPTLKIRKLKSAEAGAHKLELKFPYGGMLGVAGRFEKA